MASPFRRIRITLAIAACFASAPLHAAEPGRILAQSQKHTPAPPRAAGDERGMANAIGAGTFRATRCGLPAP
jgi:hypothetical protein